MNNTKTLSSTSRDYLFDNYKALLIALVVIGHFIEPCYQNNDFLYTLKWLIVSFHMPAFIFISGYFSKRQLSFSVIMRKLLVPYIVYEFVYYLFYIFILHKETKLYLLYPKFSLWYLLALFVWRAITPYVKKCPHYMILTISAGLFIGCSDISDNYLSLPRILYFFPYFLAGTDFDRNMLTKLQKNLFRFLSAAVIILFTGLIICVPAFDTLSVKVFYGRYNYDFLGQGVIEGILCRGICCVTGFVITFAVMLLIPNRQTLFSYLGTRTMAVYLFHGLTYSYLKDCTDLLKNITTVPQSILLLFSCALLTAVFSAAPLTVLTNKVADLKLPAAFSQITDLYTLRFRHFFHEKAAALRWLLYTRKVCTSFRHMMFLGGRF